MLLSGCNIWHSKNLDTGYVWYSAWHSTNLDSGYIQENAWHSSNVDSCCLWDSAWHYTNQTAARYKTVRGTSHWKVNNDYILLPTFGSSITPDWIRSQLLGGLQGGGMTQDRGESWTSSFISCIRGLWMLSSLISSSDEGGRNFVSFRPPPCK